MPRYANVNKGSGELYMKDYLYLACQATLKMPENSTITTNKVYADPGKQEDNTIQGNVPRTEYLSLAQRIINYYDKYGKAPGWAVNTSLGSTMSFHNLVYMYSMILGYWFESGQIPSFASMTLFSRPNTRTKTQRWKDLETALGRTFNNDKELAAAFQNHPDYQYYMNDKKTPTQTLAALKVVGGAGVNCVDVSQVVMYVLMDMGYGNVHICRGDFKCGGHVWVTYNGGKVFDAAGMMKYGYPIGRYMCSGTPWNVNVDPAWAVSDDSIT